MNYSYFPGCSMSGTAIEYQKSLAYVNHVLGLQFTEIVDWNCCGATAGHSVSRELGNALPARNLALCEEQGLGLPIAVACAACYSRLKAAQYEAQNHNEQLTRLIERPVKGDLPIVSLMEVYTAPELQQKFSAALVRPLNGLKIACYYGCLYTRPQHLTGSADTENPCGMEALMEAVGAQTVEWDFKTECCGASRHVDIPEYCRPLLRDIYRNALANGAEAVVTACPLCMMNLDMRQKRINKEYGESFALPIYFLTELLAVAFGADAKTSGIATHFTPAQGLFQHIKEVG